MDTESYAGFGSVTWQATERLSATAGLRWTTETIGINLQGVDAGARGATVYSNPGEWWRRSSLATPLRVNAVQNEEHTWDAWTYDFAPAFRLTDDINLFFRYARGFRSGGYNASVTTQAAVNTVQPERNDSIRARCEDLLAGRSPDRQCHCLLLPVARHAAQHPGCHGDGPECLHAEECRARQGSAAWAGADGAPHRGPARESERQLPACALREDFTETLPNGSIVDHSGLKFARAPEKTIGLDADYTFPLPNGHQIRVGTDWQYQSGIYYSSVDQVDPLQKQGGYRSAMPRSLTRWTR